MLKQKLARKSRKRKGLPQGTCIGANSKACEGKTYWSELQRGGQLNGSGT